MAVIFLPDLLGVEGLAYVPSGFQTHGFDDFVLAAFGTVAGFALLKAAVAADVSFRRPV
jgi:hypothetical protein